MQTLMWWTVWGLVVGIGLFSLREAGHASLDLIFALPLLSGAAAAAVLRIRHEYHQAVRHAKWLLISSVFLFLGSGYVFVRTEALGPFATGTQNKAFLGTTFEMSAPEVERAAGRKLSSPAAVERQDPESLKEWAMSLIPSAERPAEIRTLSHLVIFGIPGQVEFEFFKGKLGKVELVFNDTSKEETRLLVQRIRDDLSNSYKPAPSAVPGASYVYRKEAVEAVLAETAVDSDHEQVRVRLTYLPLLANEPGPITVDARAF